MRSFLEEEKLFFPMYERCPLSFSGRAILFPSRAGCRSTGRMRTLAVFFFSEAIETSLSAKPSSFLSLSLSRRESGHPLFSPSAG